MHTAEKEQRKKSKWLKYHKGRKKEGKVKRNRMLWCLLDPDTFEIEQKYTTEEMRKELKKDNIKSHPTAYFANRTYFRGYLLSEEEC